MAESELIEVVQLPNDEQMRKFRASDGEISYRRSDGTFLSPDVGEALEKNANRQTKETTEGNQATFSVTPRTENDREQLVQSRYGEIDSVTGLNPKKPDEGKTYENNVRSWMENETLRQQVEQDPLLDSQAERREALEARARAITDDIQDVQDEEQAIEVIKQYGLWGDS